jgi:hypothetical protein
MRRSVLTALIAAGWLSAHAIAIETLFFVQENRTFLGDVGAALVRPLAAYITIAVVLGAIAGAIVRDPLRQAVVLSWAYSVLMSVSIAGLGARVLAGPVVAVAFVVGTALAFAGLFRLLRRFGQPAAVGLFLFVAFYFSCRLMAADWALRGGSIIAFATAPATLLQALLGIAAVAVAMLVARRTGLRPGLLLAASIGALLLAIAIMSLRGRQEIAPRPFAGAGGPDVIVLSFDSVRPDELRAYATARPAGAIATLMRGGLSLENVVADGLSTHPILANNTFGDAGRTCGVSVPGIYRQHGFFTAMLLARLWKRIDGADCYDRYFVGRGAALARQFTPFALWQTLLEDDWRGRFIASPDLVDEVARTIEDHGNAPLFVYAHFLDHHVPYIPPARADDETYLAAIRRFMKRCYMHACDPHEEHDVIEIARGGYRAMFPEAEKSVERVRAILDARGRPYVLVLTADHGELLGEHGGFGHAGGFTPEVFHVPFVVFDSRRSLAGQRRCELLKSSQAHAALARLATGVDDRLALPDPAVLELAAPPLGRAIIDRQHQTLAFEISVAMRPQRGTVFNIHVEDRGTIDYPIETCPAGGSP